MVVVLVEVDVVVVVEEEEEVEAMGLRRRTICVRLRWLAALCWYRLSWSAPSVACSSRAASLAGNGAGSGSLYCATPRPADAFAAVAQPMATAARSCSHSSLIASGDLVIWGSLVQ